MKGLDTLSPVSKYLACFKQKGILFVARYLRNLKPAEVKAINAAGMQVVSIAERGNPTKASYFTRARGLADGEWAVGLAQALGQPVGSAIYFTVDCDVSIKDLKGGVTEYFRGVQFSLAETGLKVGGYGPGAVLAHLLSQHLIKYAWHANASGWSGYKTFKQANIKQGKQQMFCGVQIDPDEAQGDFGAWVLGAQATPLPAATPAQAKESSYTVKAGDSLSKIAKTHSVSLDTLLNANNIMVTHVIHPGDKLTIPG